MKNIQILNSELLCFFDKSLVYCSQFINTLTSNIGSFCKSNWHANEVEKSIIIFTTTTDFQYNFNKIHNLYSVLYTIFENSSARKNKNK